MYYVYILQCTDGSLYTGVTTDLKRRFEEHKRGVGGNYTHSRTVKKIVHSEKALNRGAAQKREAEIKSWPRQKKLRLTRQKQTGVR